MRTIVFLGFAAAVAACGGAVNGGDHGGSSSGSFTSTSTIGSSSGTETGTESSATSESSGSESASATLCTDTGGMIVETYCSANPPFTEYTCSTTNGMAICDPAPGEGPAGTPECVCPGGDSACFDPVVGCVPVDTSVTSSSTGETAPGSGSGSSPGTGACVNVDSSQYDTSCEDDSDCTFFLVGQLCSGECAAMGCVASEGTPANVDNTSTWQQQTTGIQLETLCGCPAPHAAVCTSGQCAYGGESSGSGSGG